MTKQHQLLASLALLAGPMAYRAERRYQGLGTLANKPCRQPLPSLAIIVPARNEAENLQHLLPTLQSLVYDGEYEVIVVDDQSTDGTADVARQFNTKVVEGKALPDGWLGKPYACHQGVFAAKGDWFLFTDADTNHQPDGPARAVGYAIDNGLDGLSLFLQQETKGTADTIALLVAFAGIFAALPQENSFLNGQYILLRRDVYLDSGGFAAVSSEALEDLALGSHLKSLNYRVPVMVGEDVASVRMYHDFKGLWQGMIRLGGGSLHWLGWWAFVSVAFITAVMMPVLVLGMVWAGFLRSWWFVAGWLSAVLGFISWGRRFGSTGWALLSPIGALIVQIAATWGLISRLIGRGIQWKGRTV